MATFTITQTSPNNDRLFLYPNGDLSGCTAWTANGDNPNYACVDENRKTPDYANTYVSMATDIYTTDQYTLPNTSDLGTINYVKIYNRVKINSPPSSTNKYYIALTTDSICTHTYLSGNQDLTTGWSLKSHIWELEPSAITAWAWTDIDNLTIGMKAQSNDANVNYSETIRPNGSTATTEWTPVGETDNFECVNEIVANDTTDYVKSISNDSRTDIYELQDVSLPDGAIVDSVTLFVRGRVVNGDGDWYRAGLRLNNVNKYWDRGWSGENAWKTLSGEFFKDPLGNTWSSANVNNLKVVIQNYDWSAFGDDEENQITQVYVTVNYHLSQSVAEIQVSQVYAEIGYTPSTATCYLNMPEHVSTDHNRNIKMFNFWNGDREVYDFNRNSKSIVLTGSEYQSSVCTSGCPCNRIICTRNIARNGAIVTISNLTLEYFNGDYRITQFAWKKIGSKPEHYEWMIYLEDAN